MLSVCGRRAGTTLIELVVAMVVGGVALALIASMSVHQQRLYAEVFDAAAVAGQLQDAAAVLPIDLRATSSSGGDIKAGEARDTSVELRGAIATAVVCDTTASALILAPALPGADGSVFAGTLDAPQPGDTAWIFTPGSSGDDWVPHRVTTTGAAAAGQCAPLGPRLAEPARSAPRTAIGVDGVTSLATTVGLPIRFTRPLRYSVYRASDGGWYLGERDWNPASTRFNSIQPVSGPFLSALAGGVAFRYFDSSGVLLPTPISDTRSIALVRVELRGQSAGVARELGAAGPAAKRLDSITVSVLLRNRR